MEENKKTIENEGNELSEEQLDEVAGGKGIGGSLPKALRKKCDFTPSGQSKTVSGATWLKCASSCLTCKCWSNDWCVDNWHRLNNDNTLYPDDTANHNEKTPPKYNT